MFTEIVELDKALDTIKEYNLSESQIDTLLQIINENPTITAPKLLEITDQLSENETIILDAGTYSIDPILNESLQTMNLLEFAIPAIVKHIPKEIIGYLTESHAKTIIDAILNVEFDENTTPEQLHQRIDEMFDFGGVALQVQGLRRRPESANIVLAGTFTQRLHKGIQFGKDQYQKPMKSLGDNKNTLKNALKEYDMISKETPMNAILPKYVMVLKNLLGDTK